MWDANTGKYKHTLMTQQASKAPGYHPITIPSVSFSPDGRTLANVSIDHNIHLWNTTTGTLKRTLKGHRNKVNCISFNTDGKKLVSGSQDGTIHLWDVNTGKRKKTISNKVESNIGKSSPVPVSITAFSSDSTTLASGNQDGSIYLWDVATTKIKGTFKGHTGAISSITFSPDGLTFASTSVDGSIRLWDVTTRQQKQAIAGYEKTTWRVSFYTDGLVLASEFKSTYGGLGNDFIHIWDLNTGQLKKRLIGHTLGITNLSFNADGKTLMSIGRDEVVLVWDIPTIINNIDFSE